MEFSKIVTKKREHKDSLLEWVEDTIGYAMAGVEATYIPNSTRLGCLQELGIWAPFTASFIPAAINAAAAELERQVGAVIIP